MYTDAELSRAYLSRATGLSKQTVSHVIADLESSKLVESVGITQGHIGRRAVTYRLSPNASYGIGIDLGGTNLRAGLVDFSGQVRAERAISTPHSDLKELIGGTKDIVKSLAKEIGILDSEVTQIVMGIPGVPNPQSGVVSHTPNIPYLNGVVLHEVLSEAIGSSVLVENDVNIAALGELEVIDSNDFAFLALGTGIGMAMILEGELRRGHNGGSGEIGYLTIGENVETRSDSGHFEKLVGGNSIEATYRSQTGNQKNMFEIFELAKQGDQTASLLTTELIKNLAIGIKSICAILDPQEIVLGGGIGARDDVCAGVKTHLDLILNNPPLIRVSALGSRAGLVGAMSLALSQLRGRALMNASPNAARIVL